MAVYPEDSSAAAVVLADYGTAYFAFSSDKGFQLMLDKHLRIKILNKNGLEYANQQIPLFHRGTNKEVVSGLKGVTYNLQDAKVVKEKLDKKQIFNESYNEHYNIVKFTMPNVREGSVIDIKYTVASDFIYNLVTWEFQREIPVRWSELRARVPEYFHYKNFMSGFLTLTLNETSNYEDSFNYTYRETKLGAGGGIEKHSGTLKPKGTIYRWAIEKAPAIKEEAYITTISDYTSKIEFELNYTKFPGKTMEYFSSSWEKLNKEFMEHERFGKQLNRARYMQDILNQLTAEASSDTEKISRIVQYVNTNFHCNGKNRVYTENNLKKVFDEKKGNVAEINLLLTLMLREAGLQANPVILSTRSHGRVNPVIPLQQDFNYVVSHVRLGDEYVLLDATEPTLPPGMLPYQCLNQQGRLISEDFTTWVPLLNNEIIKKTSQAELVLAESGAFSGNLTMKHEGYAATRNRLKFMSEGKEKYLEEIYEEEGWNISDHTIEDAETVSRVMNESLTVELPEAVTLAGDRMYFQPLLLYGEKENPFKLENRVFPVDFGCPMETLSMIKIIIPEGYEVEEVPEQMILSLPDQSGVFRFSVNKAGEELMVVNNLKISKAFYSPEEYQSLRKFFELVVAKHAEQVVLKKIN